MPVYTPGFTEAQIDDMAFDPTDASSSSYTAFNFVSPPAPVTWYERILNPDPETIHLHVMFTLPGIFAGWFIAKKLKGK